jgi:cytochrome c-type biogenesis protein CcmH/NrfG
LLKARTTLRILQITLGLVFVGLASAARADDLEARVNALSQALRCVVCQNQSVADSQAELAKDMKQQVREQLAAGKPDDAQGWRMLARSYETLGRFDDAVAAYRELQRLTPNDSTRLLDYAVTLAMAKGRTLSGEPAALIERVLKLEPANLQALALAGSETFERKDYDAAVRHWQAVLAKVPAGTEMAQSVEASTPEQPQ